MNTFRDLIDQWPSLREFANDLGVSVNTAAGWYRRQSIPSGYWQSVLDKAAAREIEVTADDLVSLASRAA